ncbi:SHOCT domain-containing protein [Halorientalis brevis]|uniref:SHOCT domain-containing protein n=1 Tax=Halorientalis brevis TaxID=1126241 RepID=A0ABD6CEV5_9EURY|nr:SHOCT domain-containing protein [Halorientalis brevis]
MATETTDGRLVTIVLVVLGALIALPLLFMGFGMMGGGPMMGGWGHGMWGDGGAVPGWLVLAWLGMRLAFLAALIGGAYLLYRTLSGNSESTDRAMEELRVAYARGDLSDEEYEQRREALERDS